MDTTGRHQTKLLGWGCQDQKTQWLDPGKSQQADGKTGHRQTGKAGPAWIVMACDFRQEGTTGAITYYYGVFQNWVLRSDPLGSFGSTMNQHVRLCADCLTCPNLLLLSVREG